MTECVICLEEVSTCFTCASFFCNVECCLDCLEKYLLHTAAEGMLPKCMGAKCNSIYLYSVIRSHLSKQAIDNYISSCHAAVMTKDKPIVEQDLVKSQILEQMRQEKFKYIKATFPTAITLMAEIVHKKKLTKLKKTAPAKVSGRICMNMFCPGVLDEEFKCNLCNSSFCKTCEVLIKENHKCKEEDIASLKAAQSLPQCPNCGINVDKNEACNHVQCGVCGTKFIYGTKDLGGGGGHTQMVDVKKQVRLSVAHSDLLKEQVKISSLLIALENKEPNKPSYTPVYNHVKLLLTGKSTDKVRLARVIDDYYSNKAIWEKYTRYLVEIERMLVQQKLTIEILEEVLEEF